MSELLAAAVSSMAVAAARDEVPCARAEASPQLPVPADAASVQLAKGGRDDARLCAEACALSCMAQAENSEAARALAGGSEATRAYAAGS